MGWGRSSIDPYHRHEKVETAMKHVSQALADSSRKAIGLCFWEAGVDYV